MSKYSRFLANKISDNSSSIKWKAALWDRQSIEPAMLRVPIVFISFLFLWTINLWILDRNRIQYQSVLPMKAAFPPIWLAAAASLGYFHPNLPSIVAVMATLNSLISFSWDIIMDWVLMVEIAEIFRRSMWNLYRIEWEVLVQQDRLGSAKDDEYDKLAP
eukprot:gene23905-31024_t